MRFSILQRQRILISRGIAFTLMLIFIFTRTEINSVVIKTIMNSAGLLLVAAGALGRIWSSMFICGYKRKVIIDQGPYAAVRNPLYLFSFIAVIGIALATNNLLFMGLIVILFIGYYPIVILMEEKDLIRLHGEDYLEYMEGTARLAPNLSKIILPENYAVNVKTYSRAFLDAIWFFVAYAFIDIVKLLQLKGAIPALLMF